MYELKRIDKYSYFSLRYGKIISFFLLFLLFIALFLGVYHYLDATPPSFNEPAYNAFAEYREVTGGDVDHSVLDIDLRLAVAKKYDSHIRKLLEDFTLQPDFYHTVIGWMVDLPNYRRTRFINGLHNFLDDYMDHLKDTESPLLERESLEPEYMELAERYKALYYDLVAKELKDRQESKDRQSKVLLFLGLCLLLFMLALIFPVILKIEENSRLYP